MFGKIRFSRWLIAAAVLAVAECAGVAAVEFAFTAPAQAQFFGDQQYRRAPPRSGGFLQNFFGPFNSRPYEGEYGPPQQKQPRQNTQQPSESSHAPAPRKTESKGEQVAPTTSIVVMGDGMADWLAYGLEDAFSDSPEIGVVRENKLYSGLLHYDPKGDLDWWHVARDILAQKKANYVVMMLGLSDRESIREKDLAKEAEKKEAEKKEAEKKKVKDQQDKSNADKSGQNKDDSAQKKDSVPDKEAGDPDQPSIVVPEPQPGKRANGIIEFRTEQWAAIYSRRIDATIAALKSKGVPVFWVGLPSIRGTRSTADAVYLNDLYRARAERAGAIYIDVWDGFVDEAGKYSNFGPDYEGQMRRLRLSDGVYFTKYGARKLAHYVERELRRHINNRALQVSLPSGPVAPVPVDGKSVARPLAGPVVPLTGTSGNSEELLVGAGGGSAHGDAIATKVLVKGEPVAAAPPAAAQAKGVPPAAAGASASVPAEPLAPAEKNKEEPRSGSAEKTTQKTVAKPKRPEETRPRSPRDNVLRPPRPIGPSGGPFGWVR